MKLFSEVQKIGKALMTPIAILPAAGLLLAFGNKLSLPIMEQAGQIIFSNLPLLFAIGAAIGLVGGDGVAGLAAIVAILIMNTTMGLVAGAAQGLANGDPSFAMVMGVPTLQTGVFGGLIAGIIAAICYNKFYKTELPAFLGFFAGKRLVPIMTAVVAFLVGLAMPWIWQPVQHGLAALSYLANETNTNVSTFIFVAPVLYAIHCVFAGLSFMLMNMLGVRIGMTFSGGFIDYVVFGVLPGTSGFETRWYFVILVGAIISVIYYFGFRFFIRKFNLATPGREAAVEVKEKKEVAEDQLASGVLDALGGTENLLSLDACITRLRVEVKDTGKVEDNALKSLGATGVLKVGEHGVQAIFGAKAQFICNDLKKMTGI